MLSSDTCSFCLGSESSLLNSYSSGLLLSGDPGFLGSDYGSCFFFSDAIAL